MNRDVLTLGIIAALTAGNAEAVEDMLLALSREDATWAADVLSAMKRGSAVRA